MTKHYFSTRYTAERGENRELYFTPKPIIKAVVSNLLFDHPELYDKVWIDPCAGDNRWVEEISKHGIKAYGYDIVPLDPYVAKQDFFEFTTPLRSDEVFFIGNPPFTLVKEFVWKALHLAQQSYFLGGSAVVCGTLSTRVATLHRFVGEEGNQKDKRSKIKFEDSNGNDVCVWCCGGLFEYPSHKNFELIDTLTDNSFAISAKKYCVADNRVVAIKRGVV